jgi:hypothetical protein
LGSYAGGGSDASGYLNEARLWREGRLTVARSIIAESPWPSAADTWMPLGFVAAAGDSAAMVPSYPPGLPVLMAAMQVLAGFCGAFVIVPLSGGLAIWLTYALGRRLFHDAGIALWGALLVATSPAFLFQLMNPMSDVPAAAAWTLALVLILDRRPLLAGLAMSAVITIRPNLAPLSLVPLIWAALEDRREALRLAAGIVPGAAAIALVNTRLYGSPVLSGYGSAADLYSFANVSTNLRLYGSWLLEMETPLVLSAALFFLVPGFVDRPQIRHPRLLLGGMLAAVVFLYLVYLPFDSWTYLRFFLPVWPILMVLTSAVALGALRRLPGKAFTAAAVVCVAAVTWQTVRTAVDHGVFSFGKADRKYSDVARFIAENTEPGAVMISMQHSGSLHLYTGRLTLRYERLGPGWLDRAVDFLKSTGRHPYIVLDRVEIDEFRRRFAAANQLGRLGWNPVAALSTTTYVYDAAAPDRTVPPVEIRSTADEWHCYIPSAP